MKPRIFTEEFNSPVTMDQEDVAYHNRQVYLIGKIDNEKANEIIMQLQNLASLNDFEPITLFIDSAGGSVREGLKIYDCINSLSCEVNTICLSLAASMASIIFVGGSKRYMYPNAQLMIHDPYLVSQNFYADVKDLKQEIKSLEKMRKQSIDIYCENTSCDRKIIEKWMRNETFFSAQEAVDNKLADEIIKKKGRKTR